MQTSAKSVYRSCLGLVNETPTLMKFPVRRNSTFQTVVLRIKKLHDLARLNSLAGTDSLISMIHARHS